MKKRFLSLWILAALVCAMAFPGCTEPVPTAQQVPDSTAPSEQTSAPTEQKKLDRIAPVGEIPEEFQTVLAENSFYGVSAFAGRLLKTEITSMDPENRTVVHRVWMMDLYGKVLGEFSCSTDAACHVTTLTATADGGFLFVLGFYDHAYDRNTWASDKGFASRVIKCDREGALQFDTAISGIEGSGLAYCFEKDGKFYFFGDIQTPQTKNRGVYSPTDVYMAVLDANGTLLDSRCIPGSDFDSLITAEVCEDGFLLTISAQSDDGEFAGSDSGGYPVDWVFTVSDSFAVTEKKKETGRDYFDYRIGEKDGVPVYRSSVLLDGFDAGDPRAYIDYGDFYLIVSERETGIYENTPPMISSIWYYTETVYSGYSQDGVLLFRAAVDSSPDYDARVEDMAS